MACSVQTKSAFFLRPWEQKTPFTDAVRYASILNKRTLQSDSRIIHGLASPRSTTSKVLARSKMLRLAALAILLVVFIASIDAFPKNRLDGRGEFLILFSLSIYLLLKTCHSVVTPLVPSQT